MTGMTVFTRLHLSRQHQLHHQTTLSKLERRDNTLLRCVTKRQGKGNRKSASVRSKVECLLQEDETEHILLKLEGRRQLDFGKIGRRTVVVNSL